MAPAQPELKKVRCTCSALLYSVKLLFDACLVLQLPCDLILANFSAQYLDKRLFVQLNGSRKVIGVLRGYDVSASTIPAKALG